ncbi:hypothetical protein MSZK_61400 [Mycobacterium sp. shizuoka-1]|nr:hypothetical protein MSZK_61400 [Mycobacterium sp. shizuoka-1]
MSDKTRPDLTPRRPSAAADLPAAADDWVRGGREGTETTPPPAPEPPAQPPVESSASEPTKRLTIEVPASLHHAIMVHARVTGVTAKDEITPLLRQHYADALKLYQR